MGVPIESYVAYGPHANRPISPAVQSGEASIYVETDTGNTYAWNGSVWVQVNFSGTGGSSTLAGDSDVTISSAVSGQVLKFNGTAWVNSNPGPITLTSLPTAAAGNVGQLVRISGAGSAPDKVYICRQRADGSYVWCRFQGRSVQLKMSSADYTPSASGTDLGGLVEVPYDPDENSDVSITWTVVKMKLRVETQGSTATTVNIQRSTGAGNFVNAGNLLAADLSLGASTNEVATRTFAQATVNSGDKLMPNYTGLGTGAAGFTLTLTLRES